MTSDLDDPLLAGLVDYLKAHPDGLVALVAALMPYAADILQQTLAWQKQERTAAVEAQLKVTPISLEQ